MWVRKGESLIDRTFGRIAESLRDDETVVVVAEYEALRQEILLRLQAQQNLLHHTVLVGGLPIPLLGFFFDRTGTLSSRSLEFLLCLLLVPIILCLFLQLIYLKHHLYMHLLSVYIDKELGIVLSDETEALSHFPIKVGSASEGGELEKARVFSGWEQYLTRTLMVDPIPKLFSIVLGFAEGYFPLTVGLVYVLASILTYVAVKGFQLPDTTHLRVLAGLYTTILVVFAITIVSGQLIMRRLIIRRRRID